MDRIRRLMDLPVEPSTAMRNERPTTLAEVVSLMPFLSHFFVLRAVDIYIFTERQKEKRTRITSCFFFWCASRRPLMREAHVTPGATENNNGPATDGHQTEFNVFLFCFKGPIGNNPSARPVRDSLTFSTLRSIGNRFPARKKKRQVR